MTSTTNSQMVQKRERESTNKANEKGEGYKDVYSIVTFVISVGPKIFKIKAKMGKTSMVTISHLSSVLGLINGLCTGGGVWLGC